MLTLSQQKTYDYIKQYIAERGYSPTTAEIASGIGISSRGVVYRYLKSLVEANKISLTPKRHRNIELISDESVSDYEIPLKGGMTIKGKARNAYLFEKFFDLDSIFEVIKD